MLAFLASLGIGTIATKILALQEAKRKAETDEQKLEYDRQIETLRVRQALQQGSIIDTIMRFLLAFPVAVILWKVYIWDKAMGQWTQGRTDALSPELWQVVMVVVGFYFLYEATRLFRR